MHLSRNIMPKNELSVPIELIEDIILTLRGQRVMLDRDLAVLYGVSTKVFNQAVRIMSSINSIGADISFLGMVFIDKCNQCRRLFAMF